MRTTKEVRLGGTYRCYFTLQRAMSNDLKWVVVRGFAPSRGTWNLHQRMVTP